MRGRGGRCLPLRTSPVPDAAAASSDVTVLMLGDLGFGESYMRGPKVAPLRRRLALHGHGYSLLRLRELIDSADLVVGNLEVPLAADVDPALRGQKNYLGWSDAEETVAALQEAGFDALSLANNHTLDCGEAGLERDDPAAARCRDRPLRRRPEPRGRRPSLRPDAPRRAGRPHHRPLRLLRVPPTLRQAFRLVCETRTARREPDRAAEHRPRDPAPARQRARADLHRLPALGRRL